MEHGRGCSLMKPNKNFRCWLDWECPRVWMDSRTPEGEVAEGEIGHSLANKNQFWLKSYRTAKVRMSLKELIIENWRWWAATIKTFWLANITLNLHKVTNLVGARDLRWQRHFLHRESEYSVDRTDWAESRRWCSENWWVVVEKVAQSRSGRQRDLICRCVKVMGFARG